ncbi:MAG TPA: HWE histidine kinase domain-containing protein [Steroidobacteraceae bacterium]|nr:HWE histidine kinase domain-containing protein [Steroidobacteraceae bacterium]
MRAIVRRGADGPSSKQDFAARLEGRIGALSRVHAMIMRSPQDGVDLEELLHGELLAQAIPAQRYRASGPDTRIAGEAPLPLALALHEIAVNAVIHGALLGEGGTLDVSWDRVTHDGGEWLRLVWQESAVGRLAPAPAGKGFGLELIENMLPYELDAGTRITWKEPGLRIEMEIPAVHLFNSWTHGERAAQS